MGHGIIGATIGLWVLASAAPADAATRPCAPRTAHVTASSGQTQVYIRRGLIFACHRRTRKATDLEVPPLSERGVDDVFAEPLKVAGPFVAFFRGWSGRYGESGAVRLLDSRRGTYLRIIPEGMIPSGPFARVTDLMLSTRGAVAWITRLDGPTYEVRGADSNLRQGPRYRNQLFDAGPDIGPDSLSFSGVVVSWMRGEETRTASLR